jgi:NTE family protein
MTVFIVASLACALAQSPELLIACRAVQAMGAALLVPASLALVLHAYPREQRSHGVALLSAVAAVAAGLGPSLGGLLVAAAGWRMVFLFNVPIGLTAIVLAHRYLVESVTPGSRRMPDLAGALLFALAIAALVLGIVQGQGWGWASTPIIAALALAVALGAIVIRRCRSHPAAVVDLGVLRIRAFSAANAITIITAAGYYGYTLANVLFLTAVWHYSVLKAGLALTPGPFVAAAVAGPSSRLIGRVGYRPVLAVGGLLWSGAVIWLIARVGIAPAYLSRWLPATVLLGLGAGTLFPNVSGAAIVSAPGDGFATASALNSVARQVGASLGVALVVAVIGTPSPMHALAAFDRAWTLAAAFLLVAGLGSLIVEIPPKRSPGLLATPAPVHPRPWWAGVRRPRLLPLRRP